MLCEEICGIEYSKVGKKRNNSNKAENDQIKNKHFLDAQATLLLYPSRAVEATWEITEQHNIGACSAGSARSAKKCSASIE